MIEREAADLGDEAEELAATVFIAFDRVVGGRDAVQGDGFTGVDFYQPLIDRPKAFQHEGAVGAGDDEFGLRVRRE